MPSTYTSNLRFEKQATGENRSTWGTVLNAVIEMVEDSISGWATVSMSNANYSLTTANNSADEARQMLIDITGTHTATRVLTIPSVDKMYVIRNSTSGGFDITVDNGSNTVTVENGAVKLVATNGTAIYASLDLASPTLVTLGAYDTNGLMTQTSSGNFTGRTITGTGSQISVSNGNGVSGNPTLSLPSSVTISGTMTAATFSGSGASLTSIPAGQLTGTVASARISGSYTGLTGTGALVAGSIGAGFGNIALTASATLSSTNATATSTVAPTVITQTDGTNTGTFVATVMKLGSVGTATAPQYAFTSDPNTGMYRTSTADNLFFATAGTQAGVFDENQNFTCAGDITAFSDAAVKDDIAVIDHAVELVKRLRGVRYRRTDQNRQSMGLIAQEVEGVLPELVHNGNQGKSIAYGNLVGVLIEAVKELSAKVERLENGASG